MSSILQDIQLKEDHPLAINMFFSISLGLLPVTLSVKTTGCGIQKSAFSVDEPGDMEISSKDPSPLAPLFSFAMKKENLSVFFQFYIYL